MLSARLEDSAASPAEEPTVIVLAIDAFIVIRQHWRNWAPAATSRAQQQDASSDPIDMLAMTPRQLQRQTGPKEGRLY